ELLYDGGGVGVVGREEKGGKKFLREVDGLGHRGMLLPELGELLRFAGGALRLTPEDEPGGPAGCQGLACRLRHDRQCLAPALPSGGQALGLADTAGIGWGGARAPRGAFGL